MVRILRSLGRVVAFLEDICVEILLAAMMLVIVAHVANRATLQIPSGGAWELSRFCMIIIVFIGLAIGARERGHIRIDLLSSVVKNDRVLGGVNIFFDVLLLGLVLTYWYWSIEYFRWTIVDGVRSIDLQIPLAIVVFSMVVGVALACVHFGRNLIDDVRSFRKGETVWRGQY